MKVSNVVVHKLRMSMPENEFAILVYALRLFADGQQDPGVSAEDRNIANDMTYALGHAHDEGFME